MTTFRRCSQFMIIVLVLLAAPRSQPGYAQGAAHAADCPVQCLYLPLVNAPSDISIISGSFYTTQGTSGYYEGSFISSRGKILTNVVIDIYSSYTAPDNTIVYTRVATATTVFSTTLPGMRNVFYAHVEVGAMLNLSAVVRSYDVVTQTNMLLLPVTKQDIVWDPNMTVVRGTVQNTSEFTMTNVHVLVELDGPGSRGGDDIISELAPGEIAPYETFTFFEHGTNPGPTNVLIQAYGEIVEP
jgi:hypothetical protein